MTRRNERRESLRNPIAVFAVGAPVSIVAGFITLVSVTHGSLRDPGPGFIPLALAVILCLPLGVISSLAAPFYVRDGNRVAGILAFAGLFMLLFTLSVLLPIYPVLLDAPLLPPLVGFASLAWLLSVPFLRARRLKAERGAVRHSLDRP